MHLKQALELDLQQLQHHKPLVLCHTNSVTMQWVANVLLALGASPIMSQDEREFEELVHISQAVYVNIGTLNPSFSAQAHVLLDIATAQKKPRVLDPVGAGATTIRRDLAQHLLHKIDCLRGNASEVMALGSDICNTRGVDSQNSSSDALLIGQNLSEKFGIGVAISGETDHVIDGQAALPLSYGSPLMPLVTGMGCALGAVIAAFLAIQPQRFQAMSSAIAYYGIAGQLAAKQATGPGSFPAAFLDTLHSLKVQDISELLHAN